MFGELLVYTGEQPALFADERASKGPPSEVTLNPPFISVISFRAKKTYLWHLMS